MHAIGSSSDAVIIKNDSARGLNPQHQTYTINRYILAGDPALARTNLCHEEHRIV